MTAFAAMHDTLFADPNMGADAEYQPAGGGAAVPCRVILSQPTDTVGIAGMAIAADTTMVEVRRAEIAAPVEGDVVALLDTSGAVTARYLVQGQPMLDDLRIVWTLDTRPLGA